MRNAKYIQQKKIIRKQQRKQIQHRVNEHVQTGKGISNDLIRNFCSRYCNKNFKGVYTADRIPKFLAGRKSFVIVVNLAPRGDGGKKEGHFITLVGRRDVIIYIDPYGIDCWQKDVKRFLKGCKRPVIYNKNQIQGFNSVFCGVYAILFATFMDGTTPPFQLKFSQSNFKINDKLCMFYLRKLLHSRIK